MAQGRVISSNSAVSNILVGTNAPSMLTVPPTSDPQIYIQTGTIASQYYAVIWEYTSTVPDWYPTCHLWKARHISDGLTIDETVDIVINRYISATISMAEAIVIALSKEINESISIDEILEVLLSKNISESLTITETIRLKFSFIDYINYDYINRRFIN